MSDLVLVQIQQRLQHLEDLQAIQTLKSQYLRACECRESGEVLDMDEFPMTEYTCSKGGGTITMEHYVNTLDFLYEKPSSKPRKYLCPEP